MQKTIDSTSRKFEGLKKAVVLIKVHRDNKKVRCEKRLFALRNIACEALKAFVYNEYDNVR